MVEGEHRVLAFCLVRPAWALSCRWKSGRKEVIPIEANRNCVRVTERGEEAGSEARGPMNKNRIRGVSRAGRAGIETAKLR